MRIKKRRGKQLLLWKNQVCGLAWAKGVDVTGSALRGHGERRFAYIMQAAAAGEHPPPIGIWAQVRIGLEAIPTRPGRWPS